MAMAPEAAQALALQELTNPYTGRPRDAGSQVALPQVPGLREAMLAERDGSAATSRADKVVQMLGRLPVAVNSELEGAQEAIGRGVLQILGSDGGAGLDRATLWLTNHEPNAARRWRTIGVGEGLGGPGDPKQSWFVDSMVVPKRTIMPKPAAAPTPPKQAAPPAQSPQQARRPAAPTPPQETSTPPPPAQQPQQRHADAAAQPQPERQAAQQPADVQRPQEQTADRVAPDIHDPVYIRELANRAAVSLFDDYRGRADEEQALARALQQYIDMRRSLDPAYAETIRDMEDDYFNTLVTSFKATLTHGDDLRDALRQAL